jgi:NAD(P)-dependent dehydrogenase (short-subunit alcohol dehydrogenase family)
MMIQEVLMKGKVVLVTGADGGLGRFVTQAFLNVAATVVGSSRKIRQEEFEAANFTALPADLSSREGAKALLDEVLIRFGVLDVLVHTVGGFAGGQSVADTDDATFQRMLNMNLNSVFHIVRAALPALRRSESGRILAIGSRAAAEPGAGVGAYSASKGAMLSLLKAVAVENQDAGVTANVILPGTMDTPANRLAMPNADFSKWVQPSNVASLVLWLASDAAKEITGAAIPVYGNA